MKIINLLLTLAVFSLIILSGITKINDTDTMMYLASGRYILTNGLPKSCVFTHSIDTCPPIAYPEWFLGVFLYSFYQLGQWNLLVIFQSIIITIMLSLIFISCRSLKVSLTSTVIFLIFAVLIGMERFMLRADLVSLVVATLVFFLLKKIYYSWNHLSSLRRILLIGFILFLQLIWANIHGSFPIGFLLIISYIIPLLLRSIWNFLTHKSVSLVFDKRIKLLGILLVLSVVVSMLNPYGLKAFFWPFSNIRDTSTNTLIKYIAEYQSPLVYSDFTRVTIQYFKILIIVSIILLIINIRQVKGEDIFILVPFLFLSSQAVRYLSLSAVFAAFILPQYLDNVLLAVKKRITKDPFWKNFTSLTYLIFSLLLIIIIVRLDISFITNEIYRNNRMPKRFGLGLANQYFSQQGADFIIKNNISGNMYNSYNIGSYLVWKMYPQYKTFIHGSVLDLGLKPTVDLYQYYNKVNLGEIPINEMVEKYNIDFIFLDPNESTTPYTIKYIILDKKWQLVFFNPKALIFIKNIKENEHLIKKFAINLSTWRANENDLLQISDDNLDLSLMHNTFGVIFAHLKLFDRAKEEFSKAIEYDPQNYLDYYNLANIYKNLNNLEKASEYFQKSITLKDDFANSHYYLADILYRKGNLDGALNEYGLSLKYNRFLQDVNYKIGTIYEAKGSYDKAREYYQTELKLQPDYKPAMEKIIKLRLK